MMVARIEMRQGHVIERLKEIPSGTIQAVITSPPYWGLRDYRLPEVAWADGWTGSLGLEPTPDGFVVHLVEVFAEIRRVLRKDGTAWLNLGDSFFGDSPVRLAGLENFAKEWDPTKTRSRGGTRRSAESVAGLKASDLAGIPWRVAFALQADGWWVRSDIIWAKGESFNPERVGSVMPEPMNGWRWERCRVPQHKLPRDPENLRGDQALTVGIINLEKLRHWIPCPGCPKCSPNDGLILKRSSWRPTRAHEFIFLLAKSKEYFCNAQAVKEDGIWEAGTKAARGSGAREGNRRPKEYAEYSGTRNPRSVWSINVKAFKEAHFATFPEALVEPMVLAGSSQAACGNCGAPWAEIISTFYRNTGHTSDGRPAQGNDTGNRRREEGCLSFAKGVRTRRHDESLGFRPTCACASAASILPSILDPFAGAGTVGVVCKRLNRNFIGIELNPAYIEIAERRLASIQEGEEAMATRGRPRKDPNAAGGALPGQVKIAAVEACDDGGNHEPTPGLETICRKCAADLMTAPTPSPIREAQVLGGCGHVPAAEGDRAGIVCSKCAAVREVEEAKKRAEMPVAPATPAAIPAPPPIPLIGITPTLIQPGEPIPSPLPTTVVLEVARPLPPPPPLPPTVISPSNSSGVPTIEDLRAIAAETGEEEDADATEEAEEMAPAADAAEITFQATPRPPMPLAPPLPATPPPPPAPEVEAGTKKRGRPRKLDPDLPVPPRVNGLLGSILSYPSRGEGGESKFRGNFPGDLVRDLLTHFKPQGVFDPMEGSGTTADVCAEMNVAYVGRDLAKGHAENCALCAPLGEFGADLIIWHPPYAGMIPYESPEEGAAACNLSLLKLPDFEAKCEVVMLRLAKQVLVPGGHLALLIGDWRKNGKYHHLLGAFLKSANRAGLDLESLCIKMQHRTSSAGNMYVRKEGPPLIPILHEFLAIWKRPKEGA